MVGPVTNREFDHLRRSERASQGPAHESPRPDDPKHPVDLYFRSVRATVVVLVLPPPVPVIVMVWVPVLPWAFAVTVMVEVPEPGAMNVGLKETVTLEGAPLADKVIDELKLPVMVAVIVDVPLAPCITVSEEGDADRVKPLADEVIVRETVAVCVMP